LSQRLSRLVRIAESPAAREVRAIFPGAAITVERSKFSAPRANSRLFGQREQFRQAVMLIPGEWRFRIYFQTILVTEKITCYLHSRS
jgi:hypothetical protein